MKKLVTIVGPTAVGKTQLALQLAQQFNGEIVNADSRQVYRYMDIGTAKPEQSELAIVPHQLIDIVNPDEDFGLAQYQALANQAIADIHSLGKLPLLVGGTGQYVRAVLEGWVIPAVAPDPEFRLNLQDRAEWGESAELYQELVRVDPVAAQNIDSRNVRRVIRALEVSHHAGVPFSRLQQKKAPPFDSLIIGLTAERTELYRRIDSRVDIMLDRGLVEETKKLVSMGYGFDLPSMSGIGYKQVGQYLKGEITLEVAKEQIKFETHRLARHQYNWFRLSDKRIQWFDVGQDIEAEVREWVSRFIAGNAP
ncbi:MAG: tRNA (adenosine(37)-N6)-dimethylallyltransferase MiaA [Dehalococcoidales bacterium]|nr:tRNA (adenosine(37)-N6)-dimethylallyltransferase MiaA [Dehalococcoidales bacterium]